MRRKGGLRENVHSPRLNVDGIVAVNRVPFVANVVATVNDNNDDVGDSSARQTMIIAEIDKSRFPRPSIAGRRGADC